jgi:DsbC/DsbD-like thiol-disulfide interchange protein
MLRLAPFLFVTFAAGPALAGATPWQDIALGAKARLISADKLSDGTTIVGLQLDMPANTKTYWRIPGETGIPTEFNFSASTGLSAPVVDWPYPQIDRSEGYLDYVYYGPLVIPIRFASVAEGGTIDAIITLGVCSDICVPAQAKFSLPVSFAKPDAGQSIRLDQAEARGPIAWDKPTPAFGAVTATAAGLTISSPDPSIDPGSLIADVGDPAILFETPQKSPDNGAWTVKLLGGAAATGLEGRGIQLTFMTPSGPYAVGSTITAPAR